MSLSHLATLPATGLDILLVGPRDMCEPIAQSLLRVTFDRDRPGRGHQNEGDVALDALRSHLSAQDGLGTRFCALKARHVRLTETLPLHSNGREDRNVGGKRQRYEKSGGNSAARESQDTADQQPRVDHVVLVLSARDAQSIPKLRRNAGRLHPDYALMNRLSILVTLGGDDGGSSATIDTEFESFLEGVQNCRTDRRKKRRRRNKEMGDRIVEGINERDSLFPVPVPVYRCNLDEGSSRLAVSRMLLQRAKLGTRGCDDGVGGACWSGAGSGVSPMFFSSLF